MKKLYLTVIAFEDRTILNYFGSFNSEHEATEASMKEPKVVRKITDGKFVEIAKSSLVEQAVQNTDFDFTTRNIDGALMGVYFNFQNSYPQELKDDLESLIKKHFKISIEIKTIA